MASSSLPCSYALVSLLLLQVAFSQDPTRISPPSPSPSLAAADGPSPISSPPAGSPSVAPLSSPPSPPPSESPSPAPSPSEPGAPTPSPSSAADLSRAGMSAGDDTSDEGGKSDGGMSRGRKAGIAFAVIVCAVAVVIGGMVYKKRQENIRRSQYGYTGRREIQLLGS